MRDDLEKEGWQVGSVTSGQHLHRTVEMYEELGFEICLEEIKREQCGGCTECYSAGGEAIYRIYTRPKSEEIDTQ